MATDLLGAAGAVTEADVNRLHRLRRLERRYLRASRLELNRRDRLYALIAATGVRELIQDLSRGRPYLRRITA